MVLALAAVTWVLYQQSFSFDYTYFDDHDYVLGNPVVLRGLSLEGLQWAMTSFYASNWHPLTWLSHMLDVSLFGPGPRAAHIHNTLLHAINSALVYALLYKLFAHAWRAAILALIFLVHPLHVESVAWIAERKDLLCAVFFLAGLLAYDAYRHSSRALHYIVTVACMVLALMAKPMAVSFPVILVLLDLTHYRGHWVRTGETLSWRTLVLIGVEKTPFIVLTAGACVLTVLAQDGSQAVAYLDAHSLTDRLETAARAYLTYTGQWLVPINLVAFYPLAVTGSLQAWLVPSLVVLAACALAFAVARRFPRITLGWGWYMVTLLPVIGLVQVGTQAHADRYMYLPSIGLLIIGSALFRAAGEHKLSLAYLISGVFVLFLTLLCFFQIGTWQNQHSVFSRVLELQGPNHKAHVHLTHYYQRHGALAKAESHAHAAIALQPRRSDGFQALGNIALTRNQYSKAEEYYRQALHRGPVVGAVLNNLGIALAQQGRQAEARRAFTEALRVDPALEAARQNIQRPGTVPSAFDAE